MSEPDIALIHERVQRGFDWIKGHSAKYDLQFNRVNLYAISIQSLTMCVLAQASGLPFDEILFKLYVDKVHNGMTDWCIEHGFIGAGNEDSVRSMEYHWIRLIATDDRS